jgi:hypothetical protein
MKPGKLNYQLAHCIITRRFFSNAVFLATPFLGASTCLAAAGWVDMAKALPSLKLRCIQSRAHGNGCIGWSTLL